MLDISRDIDSLSSFKRNSAELIDQLKRTGEPLVLTVHGKPALVVQDARSYQRLLDWVDQAEAIAGIRRGLQSVERGEGLPAEKAFAKLRRKYKIAKRA